MPGGGFSAAFRFPAWLRGWLCNASICFAEGLRVGRKGGQPVGSGMAQAVVPAMQCQVGAKAAVRARPAAGAGGRVWGVRRSGRGTSGFKAMSLSTASTGVVPRLEQMLNMDTKLYTDKIIAEYIWYAPCIPFCR